MPKPKTPATPTNRGNSVRHEVQEYIIPPHVNGMRNDTLEATKSMDPSQSKFLILRTRSPAVLVSFRNMTMKTVPTAIMGTFIQNIQRQETFWAKAPPIKGPVTLPMAHMEASPPNQATRCQRSSRVWNLKCLPPRAARGTRSVTRISPSDMIPPPPIPCIDRPTSIIVKFFASADTTDPMKKKRLEARINLTENQQKSSNI